MKKLLACSSIIFACVIFSVSEDNLANGISALVGDWFISSAHAIPADCANAWQAAGQSRSRSVPEILLSDKCFARSDRPRVSPVHRLFYPIDWVGAPSERFVALAEDALKQAMQKYDKLGLPNHKIDLVFAPDKLYTTPAYAFAGTDASPRPDSQPVCQILLYEKSWNTESDKYLLHTVAHEAFHCVQLWLSPERLRAEGSPWWVEGTAEYFANVVYPCEGGEQPSVDNFGQMAANSSLLELDYDNVVFFQFLANEIGNRGVIDFIGLMPEEGGLKRQLDALSAYPNMAEIFHRFGKQYLDGKISDSCPGRSVLVDADYETTEITDGEEVILLFPKPFQLLAHELVFDAGHYEIEVESTPVEMEEKSAKRSNADSKSASRNSWEKLPNELDVACRERTKLLTLLTSTENRVELITGSPINLRLKISREDFSGGVGSGSREVDECLVGRWQLEPSSFEAMGNWLAPYLDQRFSGAPGVRSNTEYQGFSGGMGGSFTPGGKIYGDVKGLKQKLKNDQKHKILMKNVDIKMETEVTIDSNSCADYSANGSELFVWNVISKDAINARVVTTSNGKRIVSDQPVDLNMSDTKLSAMIDALPQKYKDKINTKRAAVVAEVLRFPYRCSGEMLELDGPLTIEEGAPSIKFRKIKSPK